jgi:hypothetical protein
MMKTVREQSITPFFLNAFKDNVLNGINNYIILQAKAKNDFLLIQIMIKICQKIFKYVRF